jgi:hypothetical protein
MIAGIGLSLGLVVGQTADTGKTTDSPKTEAVPATPSQSGAKLDRRVSAQFSEATFDDMLKWLSSQGVNFAAGHSAVDKGAKITFSFTNAPLKDVMDAMAAAFGGHWTKKGEMYVFRTGPGSTAFDLKLPTEEWDLGKLDLKDLPKLEIEDLSKLEGNDLAGRSKQAQELTKLALELAEKAEKLRSQGKSDAEIEKALAAEAEALAKKASEMAKDVGKLRDKLELRLKKDGKSNLWTGPLIEELKIVPLPKIEFDREGSKADLIPELKSLRAGFDGKQLIESITAEQWKKHESKGYLTPADLTAKQRELLGTLQGDRWEIQVVIGSKKLKIKSS